MRKRAACHFERIFEANTARWCGGSRTRGTRLDVASGIRGALPPARSREARVAIRKMIAASAHTIATHPYTVAAGTDRIYAEASHGAFCGVGITDPARAPDALGCRSAHPPTP